MYKFKKIPIDVYGDYVHFIKCDGKQYVRAMRKQFGINACEPASDLGGWFCMYIIGGQHEYFLWLEDKDYLAHEIFHLVCCFFRDKDIKLTKSSEEAYAYLISYLDNEMRKIK